LAKNPTVSVRLKSAIKELRALHRLLLRADVDPRTLNDFRDALNRVRNTAWAAQRSAVRSLDGDTEDMPSLLASERVRAAYQICRSVREDLASGEIDFHKGQLIELDGVITEVAEQLKKRL
jgi:hypothetical protein